MKPMKLLNRIILQWFFIRLTKCEENCIIKYEPVSYDLMEGGVLSARAIGKIQTIYWYSIQYWVKPLSGYNGKEYKYLNKGPKYLRITRKWKLN